mgnify:CR=1 FL=1
MPLQLMTKHLVGRVLGDDDLSPQPTEFVSSRAYAHLAAALKGDMVSTQEDRQAFDTTILPDADRDTLYIVNKDARAVFNADTLHHAAEMYENLAYLTQTLVDANEAAGGTRSFSALRPTRHTGHLGEVVAALPVAAGLHGRPTFNRAGLVVQVQDPATHQGDAVFMLIDRASGGATDPELFSVDSRMDPEGLYKASSVRSCLGQDDNVNFQITGLQHLDISGKANFRAGKLGLVDGNHFAGFSVEWREAPHAPTQRDDFYVCCANKLRSQNDESFTNDTHTYARTFPVTDKKTGAVYSTHNPAWRLHRISPH